MDDMVYGALILIMSVAIVWITRRCDPGELKKAIEEKMLIAPEPDPSEKMTYKQAEETLADLFFTRDWHRLESRLSEATANHRKETARVELTRDEAEAICALLSRADCDNVPTYLEVWHWLKLQRAAASEHVASNKISDKRRLEFARWLYRMGHITDHPVLPGRK